MPFRCAQTIAKGQLTSLDTSATEKIPGVRGVLHRENIGDLFRSVPGPRLSGMCDERRPPFEDDVIRYYGQYIALAVAETFEAATEAAAAVRAKYKVESPDVSDELKSDGKPKSESERGDADKAFGQAAVRIDQTYSTPVETHNPIELHATVAVWDGASVTLYESTQAVNNHRSVLSQMLGVPDENVRVISRFLGSGFGGKLWPWPHSPLAAAAARKFLRPVKLVVSRRMMFQNVGHRPRTQQHVKISATAEGKLTSLSQDYVYHASILDDYKENCGEATPYLYSVPNLRVTSGSAKRNVGSATSMRGPGAVPGLFATESAMDELAIALKIDPVQLRLQNEPEKDEGLKIPFSSRHLIECFKTGSEKFGWARRTPEVGSMKQADRILGWGMAACSWIAERFAANASVALLDDGSALVSCGTQDIGTGTYTILAQIAAGRLGLPLGKVRVVLGDTSLPEGPISGGSMVTASVIPAVLEAAEKSIDLILDAAGKVPGSPFAKSKPDELVYDEGRVRRKDAAPESAVAFETILKRGNMKFVRGAGSSKATFGEKPKLSMHSYGAHFIEVSWEPQIARLRVRRIVTVIDAGRILNPLAGHNQIEGAVVMGIGMAMLEKTEYDRRSARRSTAIWPITWWL